MKKPSTSYLKSTAAGLPEAATKLRTSILPLLVAILLIPAVLANSPSIFGDGDTSWHIATGQWILDHRAIPHTDPFSFTWAGKPWVPIEWLAEVLYASAYRLAGYAGVAALVTAVLMALHAVVFVNARRWVRAALLPIVAMDFALIPMLLARPHVLTWPILAFWTWLILRARREDRAPPLAAALLMTLWANLHGGFVFGIAIAGFFGLEALVMSADKPRAFRQWLLFGVLSVAAVFINGNGFEGVVHPLQFTHLKMLPLIEEWKPSRPEATPFFFAVLVVVVALIAWKRPWLPWTRGLLLAAFFALAMYQARHQATLAIVAAMVLPEAFATGEASVIRNDRSLAWITLAGAALLVLLRGVLPLQPPENDANPWRLIAAVPPELRSQPVLNGYTMGGPLILSGIRPYVDGRGDMYGDEHILGYARIAKGDRQVFAATVRRWNIRWAMVPSDNKAFIRMLDSTRGWRRIAADKVGAIYLNGNG